mgnify:CR=1 FL=1
MRKYRIEAFDFAFQRMHRSARQNPPDIPKWIADMHTSIVDLILSDVFIMRLTPHFQYGHPPTHFPEQLHVAQ